MVSHENSANIIPSLNRGDSGIFWGFLAVAREVPEFPLMKELSEAFFLCHMTQMSQSLTTTSYLFQNLKGMQDKREFGPKLAAGRWQISLSLIPLFRQVCQQNKCRAKLTSWQDISCFPCLNDETFRLGFHQKRLFISVSTSSGFVCPSREEHSGLLEREEQSSVWDGNVNNGVVRTVKIP